MGSWRAGARLETLVDTGGEDSLDSTDCPRCDPLFKLASLALTIKAIIHNCSASGVMVLSLIVEGEELDGRSYHCLVWLSQCSESRNRSVSVRMAS